MMLARRVFFAALLIGLACTAAAQQSIYRCGNRYQANPCDAGQKGRVVGSTGSPPAAAPNPVPAGKAGSAADPNGPVPEPAVIDAHYRAQKCQGSRELFKGTMRRNEKFFRADMRKYRCAMYAQGEKRCAEAQLREAPEACKEFMSAESEP